jgi:hypothetical protein
MIQLQSVAQKNIDRQRYTLDADRDKNICSAIQERMNVTYEI